MSDHFGGSSGVPVTSPERTLVRSTPDRFTLERLAEVTVAVSSVAPETVAPDRLAPVRSPPSMFAPDRLQRALEPGVRPAEVAVHEVHACGERCWRSSQASRDGIGQVGPRERRADDARA